MLSKVAVTGVDLDSVYAQTLQRIRDQKGDRSRLGIKVLMWISHAERPLRIDELCHALAVRMEKTNLDPGNIRPKDVVLGSCLGLAVIDEEASTVRPIHYTLQEYLSDPLILPGAHEAIGETCLAYLNYEQIRELPANRIPNPRDSPFLEYSSLYWGSHAKLGLSSCGKSLAMELLTMYGDHVSATLLFNHLQSYDSPPVTDHQFTGLHCASYFGAVEIVAALIKMESCDVNQSDCEGFTPLMWAARRGNEGVVRLLLTLGDINPDIPDIYGQTPFWTASLEGHEGVVRILLERTDVDPDRPENHGQTPLWRASSDGHEGLVRLLLARRDVNPDKPSDSGETPLWRACLHGHDEVVELLLARDDVNPDKPDNYGRTPLSWASGSGNEAVVTRLLARSGVDPERPDHIGRTPLLIAYMHGHQEIITDLKRKTARRYPIVDFPRDTAEHVLPWSVRSPQSFCGKSGTPATTWNQEWFRY